MISLIITLVILILVIGLTIYGINVALKKTVDSFISKEKFQNFNNLNQIPNLDACKKIDYPLKNTLNSQTGTNIPLSPIYYNDHVGELNIYKNKPNDELKDGSLCAYQNELLYDGIWKSEVTKKNNGFLNQHWVLTNGDIKDDYVCSDKFIQLNKTMPNDYVTLPQEKQLDTGIYFNDMKDDPLDLQINCFPDEFNKGIVECNN
mgnify:CR=1 FL=1